MKQYIWFHPLYVEETSQRCLLGQKDNAMRHQYIILEQNQLHQVCAGDHLTIVGHSSAPNSQDKDDDIETGGDDIGHYIQGETAIQCIARLSQAGLKTAPRVLSLECCYAAVENGIAYQFSSHSFFKNTIIEANTNGIGRIPVQNFSTGMTRDRFGRVLMNEEDNPWIFLRAGKKIAEGLHGQYTIEEILRLIPHQDSCLRFILSFFQGDSNYSRQTEDIRLANEFSVNVPKST